MGNGICVRHRHTATPEKKKGIAITAENSRKLKSVSTARDTSSGMASMVTNENGIASAMANVACTTRIEVSFFWNHLGSILTARAPAVIPNMAIEIETKAR